MTSTIIIILAAIVYSVAHSLLATLGVKSFVINRFGAVAERWYRLGYNLFAGFTLLPLASLPALLPDKPLYTIPFPWIVLSSAGQLLAAGIILVGMIQTDLWSFLGLRQIISKRQPGQPGEFVANGLYRWVRHPLYTGGLLLIWLTPVMTVNLLTLFACFSIYLFTGAIFEEKRLVHEFGEAYQRYQEEVPMIIPVVNVSVRKPEDVRQEGDPEG
jgi:protein-S-isoprenylcysteine O-methyltransferase Ste14